jgi:hypothetical protein
MHLDWRLATALLRKARAQAPECGLGRVALACGAGAGVQGLDLAELFAQARIGEHVCPCRLTAKHEQDRPRRSIGGAAIPTGNFGRQNGAQAPKNQPLASQTQARITQSLPP